MSETEEFKPYTILPGETVSLDKYKNEKDVIKIGPGLLHEKHQISAMKAGTLKNYNNQKWWIDSSQRRYVPSLNEHVIGKIIAKTQDYFRVDIGSAHSALLSTLAFEGATKRNKPNLEIGALVYARVSLANKDMEPELECISATTGKANGFGELKNGFLIKCSLGLCRSLLNPNTPILTALGEHFAFETAIGMNGRVWLNTADISNTILLSNAIKNSEFLSAKEIKQMVKELVKQSEDDMEL
ncbi:hypothetical protein BCR36DRAFT_353753 [Piromyces finnis]|uniref:Ribosomal RNA-processing protein 40 n=1 Tax=Piromyces finnis TaxID=1754191 RepID=A0A1Y1V7P5_9FUNG|nr:hypothetical protein BCR36DRAFT_353753 [Piromyces finnis]|eukprot:ORX49315.1 hypothetical protein BCR36DRAFT_353753 [Piromyces finnis]